MLNKLIYGALTIATLIAPIKPADAQTNLDIAWDACASIAISVAYVDSSYNDNDWTFLYSWNNDIQLKCQQIQNMKKAKEHDKKVAETKLQLEKLEKEQTNKEKCALPLIENGLLNPDDVSPAKTKDHKCP